MSTIVILGATGDLAREKLFPALMRLYHDGGLPKGTAIIGCSRRVWSDSEFRIHIEPFLNSIGTPEEVASFLNHIQYHQSTFDDVNGFSALAQRIRGPVLLYLSIGPHHYTTVIDSIKQSTLAEVYKRPGSKILIEKPFGLSGTEAEILEKHIQTLCREDQVYRIDHYLAKPRVIELMRQPLPFTKKISSIAVRLYEVKDVGTRFESYDAMGALIDVGQNHLLEVLATVLMKPTSHTNHEVIRLARAQVIESLTVNDVVCAQYEEYGGRAETYFKLLLRSNISEFHGVDIVLEAGKALVRAESSVVVTFDDGTKTVIDLQSKRADAYEKLFADSLADNDELFPSFKEIRAAWTLIDEARKRAVLSPLHRYKKGTLPS